MHIKFTNNKNFKRDRKFYQIAIKTLKRIKKKNNSNKINHHEK